MKFFVFDFEVFKYDCLLGIYDLNNQKYIQTWDLDEIKLIYENNKDVIWVGHNNSHYDNQIIQSVVFGINPYITSKRIIDESKKVKLEITLYYYDLMSQHFVSLKVIEAQMGYNICESEIDFNIDRPLTDMEKLKVEEYNKADLNQTLIDLKLCKSEIQLRFDIAKEFNLSLDVLHYTEAQIAAKVLGAKRIEGIEDMEWKPVVPLTLRVKNQRVLNYYIYSDWKYIPSIKVDLCGVEHIIAKGGIHAAQLKTHWDWAFYLDVSGYYNLVMMNYDLFPRTIPEEGKKLYEYMYHEQLRLKKIDPIKRGVYKTILLAVFGASTNQYTDFYDPNKGKLVTVLGELFLVDLLEKLEGKVNLIQSNTDGIIIQPLEGVTEEELRAITDEWQQRTGFVLKFDKIYDIYQRDVNCYMYRDDKGKIHVKGAAVKYYEQWENPFPEDAYTYSSPYIIHYCIVEYFMNGIDPKDTIQKYRDQYRMFQFIIKPGAFDYLTIEDGQNITKLQNINRVFASKKPGVIYKNDKFRHNLYENLPEQVFVHNESILDKPFLGTQIDYSWYERRAWKGIAEFRKDYEQLTLF